jgi:hypothetical protein
MSTAVIEWSSMPAPVIARVTLETASWPIAVPLIATTSAATATTSAAEGLLVRLNIRGA